MTSGTIITLKGLGMVIFIILAAVLLMLLPGALLILVMGTMAGEANITA